MSNTISVRLPEDLLQRLRDKVPPHRPPHGHVVRESLEVTQAQDALPVRNQAWRKYVGIIKGGPKEVSTRKGSRADERLAATSCYVLQYYP